MRYASARRNIGKSVSGNVPSSPGDPPEVRFEYLGAGIPLWKLLIENTVSVCRMIPVVGAVPFLTSLVSVVSPWTSALSGMKKNAARPSPAESVGVW